MNKEFDTQFRDFYVTFLVNLLQKTREKFMCSANKISVEELNGCLKVAQEIHKELLTQNPYIISKVYEDNKWRTV